MPNASPGAALCHGMTDRRVVGLRERLVRSGAADAALGPESGSDPAVFDERVDQAVRTFQQLKGLIVDGVVGPDTESALNDAQYSLGDRPLFFQESAPLHGDDVEELQNNLSLLGFYYGHLSGTFTPQTAYAVKELQRSLGVTCSLQYIGQRPLMPSCASSDGSTVVNSRHSRLHCCSTMSQHHIITSGVRLIG